MYAGTGHLTNGVQARNTGTAGEIGHHPTHHIVRGRRHRNRLVKRIDATGTTDGEDAGKARGEVGAELRGVQKYRAKLLLLAENLAGHDIPWGEFGQAVALGHKPLPAAIEQDRPFPAHGFRNQGERILRGIEGRGVKLDELHVRQPCTGPVRDGEAVTGGHLWIGGVSVNLTAPASGEHGRVRHQFHGPTGEAGAHPRTLDPVFILIQEQIEHPGHFNHLNVRCLAHFGHQRAGNLGAGLVAVGVHDAVAGVCRFLPQLEVAVGVEIEAGPSRLEFAHPGRSFLHQHLHRFGIAQRGAGGERILSVQVAGIARAEGGRNAPLGVGRGRIKERTLGEDRHRPVCRGAPGGMESADSTANYKEPRADPVSHSTFQDRTLGPQQNPRPACWPILPHFSAFRRRHAFDVHGRCSDRGVAVRSGTRSVDDAGSARWRRRPSL